MSKVKKLDELLAEGKPIYVKNNARIAGKFLINFSDPHSKKIETVTIPRTFLPINLNQFVTPAMISGSYDLRSWITKGLLTLVDQKDAEEELADPENNDELKRLFLSEFSKDSSAYSEHLQKITNIEPVIADTPITFGEEDGEVSFSINPRILSFVEKLRAEELDVHAGLQELKIMEKQKEITRADCDYVISELNDGQVKNAVQKIRTTFVGEGEEEEVKQEKRGRGRPKNKKN